MAETARRLVELNHPISEGMITYPGIPGPRITDFLTREDSRAHYEPGTEFAIGRIELIANTGTYLDTPNHRYADGHDLAGLDLARVADVPITLVDLTGLQGREITPADLPASGLDGTAVLLRTGWDRHWGTEAYLDTATAPFVGEAAAAHLAASGAVLVGIDSVNIDDASGEGRPRPAHSGLLTADIPILEHLTGLDRLPATGARLHAAPPRIAGLATFPTRAYAIVGS
ncbi:cyclase family protein [Glycomyces sp. NPDC046736]|uniref:cyclase family protein n=1 Tax=Glycomyces sp. NPDC046736 TaxID=3155615 RepID=UPI0033F917A0